MTLIDIPWPPDEVPSAPTTPAGSSGTLYETRYYIEFKFLDEDDVVQTRYYDRGTDADTATEMARLAEADGVQLTRDLNNDEPPYEFGIYDAGYIPRSRFVSFKAFRVRQKYTRVITNTAVGSPVTDNYLAN